MLAAQHPLLCGMNGIGMKYKLILAGICISIILAGWWIYKSPQKDVFKKIQWSIDEATGKEVPLFELYYKWDEVEENDPTWMIFPKEGKWWVVDLRDVMRLYSEVKPKSDLYDKIRKYRQEFTHTWIENRKFQPKASRYEAVMTTFGFSILFSIERHAFSDILEGTKDFSEGRLYPDQPELSEIENHRFSSLANKSVREFNTFL
jgi:hypothetical protein